MKEQHIIVDGQCKMGHMEHNFMFYTNVYVIYVDKMRNIVFNI